MKTFNQIFFKGLIFVLPVSLTFYFLYWASVNVENLFGSLIKLVVGKEFYLPGSGIILTILFVFLMGLLVTHYLTASIIKWFTQFLERFPLVKAIYTPLKDLMTLIPGQAGGKNRQEKVVLVHPFKGSSVKVMGLVTQDALDEIHLQDHVSVYVPLSYMLGGITLLVPREELHIVDLTVEQALKLSITSWVKAK